MKKNEYDVRVSVDGTDLGTFDTFTGGEVDSDETTYKPGAMGPRISLGGSVNVGNVTVGRLYVLDRDHVIMPWLLGRAGKGTMVISKQPLDVDGNAYGKSLTYRGKLKQVTPPEVDSNSSDAALLELEMTPDGAVV